jgi:hypothetical protein
LTGGPDRRAVDARDAGRGDAVHLEPHFTAEVGERRERGTDVRFEHERSVGDQHDRCLAEQLAAGELAADDVDRLAELGRAGRLAVSR